jgi:hypothetical protein
MHQAVRPLAAACGFVVVAAVSARAQSPPAEEPSAEASPRVEFLSRFDYRMAGNALSGDDQRFSFDAHWVGDFDLVDYAYGRLTFLADYQAILGEEFRPFDPYQSNYHLQAAASWREGAAEWALVFHHLSRHLGDRPKRDSVAMNAWLVRMLKQFERNGTTIDVKGDVGPVVARAWLDYQWWGNVHVVVRRPISPRAGFYARGMGETYGCDADVAGRGQQWGGRIESGLRVNGRGAAIEVFGGFERMIDADPLDRQTRQWAIAGLRVSGN